MMFAVSDAAYHWALDIQIWSGVVFFLLVTVLGAFVAPGVGKAMAQRQKDILSRVKQAEIALEEIEQLRARQREERRRMLEHATELLREAKSDATTLRTELVTRAKREVERTHARSEREIHLLTQKAMHELWSTSADLSVTLARKIVETEINSDDHERLFQSALQEIAQTQEASA